MIREYKFEILLFIVYLLIAFVFTSPLVFKLNGSIYGVRGDHFVQLWESWWRKKALLSGESLTYTDLIYAPSGYDFSGSPIQPLPTILNLGLTLLTNEVLALNILLLLSFPLSGLAIYLLVKRLTGNKLASAFSGLVYAFSMYHFSHAWEHSTLISIYWVPFYALGLVNLDGKKSVKSVILAALAFALVLLDNFYYGYMMVFFSVFFFLFRWRSFFNRRGIKLLLLFSILCSLFVAPIVLPLLKGTGTAAVSYKRSEHDLNWFSARPWFYVLPSTKHPFLGNFSQKILDWIATKPPYFLTQPFAEKEHNLYLTWTALILSSVAVFRLLRSEPRSDTRRWVWTFFFLAIVMAIFSAPPYATISLHKIYFPSHFLYKFFPMFRSYARFGVLVLLCVAVLGGIGLGYLLRRIKDSWLRYTLVVALSIVVLFEVWLPPFNVDLTPPKAYLWLKDQPGDFIVLEFPPRTDHSALLYQRVHGKRLFNPVCENPQDVLHAPEDQVSEQALLYRDIRERPEKFLELGVKYVIFHENDPFLPFDLGYFREPQFKIVERSGDVVIYEIVSGE